MKNRSLKSTSSRTKSGRALKAYHQREIAEAALIHESGQHQTVLEGPWKQNHGEHITEHDEMAA